MYVPSTVISIGKEALGFYGSDAKKLSGFKLICTKDSAAYGYAKENGFSTAELPEYERINGSNRYDTAAQLSKKSFQNGTKTVIIASGEDYADALIGVPLANKLGAPILLCSKDKITDQTVSEIKRLGAQSIIILGGTGAVGEKVEGKLKEITSDVTRIEGSSRFETSVRIFFIICKP